MRTSWFLSFLLLPWLARAADTPVESLPRELQTVFLDAEAAWQSGRLDAALTGFTAITEAQPDFDRAWRRACGVRVEQRQYARAIDLCREAVSRRASLENRTGLAIALIHGAASPDEARVLVDEVTTEDPTFVPGWQALCTFAMEHQDHERLRACVTGLQTHTPTAPAVPVFRSLLLAFDGDYDAAWEAVDAASDRGVTEAMLAAVRSRIYSRQAEFPAEASDAGTGWSLADVAPVGIVLLLVVGIGVLALSDDEDDDDEPGEAAAT